MMANAGYFARCATFLAGRGVDCFTLDFRGHGASKPPDARSGSWTFDDYVTRDLPAAFAAVAAAAGVAPGEIGYLGHSLGGLVGLAAFGSGTVPAPRRLVLAATNVWLPARGERRRRVMAGAFFASARLCGRMPARALRLGSEDEPRGYVAQFAGWARSGRWTSLAGVDYQAGLGTLRCPTLVVVGDGDWMCTPHDARALADRLSGPVTIRCVGRLRGDALDPDHFQLFTGERMRERLWPELAAFLAA